MNKRKRTALWITAMELFGNTGCHQRPDRSFFVNGYQLPLCARCTGIAVGELLAVIPAVMTQAKASLSAALLVPMAIDGVLQLTGVRASTNLRRFVTGLMGGIGIMLLYGRAIRAIFRFVKG